MLLDQVRISCLGRCAPIEWLGMHSPDISVSSSTRSTSSTGLRLSKNNTGDPKALWSKVSALLKAPTGASSSSSTHTADDFAAYFKNKVDVIRAATSRAPPPSIEERLCGVLSGTTAEITKIVSCSPAKHCSLDPCSVDLAGQARPSIVSQYNRVDV